MNRLNPKTVNGLKGIYWVAGLSLMLSVAAGTAADTPFDAKARSSIVETICDQLIDGYIYLETAETIAEDLRRRRDAGDYDDQATPGEFAQRLTDDLYSLSNDKHLRVRGGEPSDDDASDQRPRRRARRRAGGDMGSVIGKVEVLDGNIGYLEVKHFSAGEESVPAIDRAMKALADVDALIIDVGRNPGGTAFPLRYLSTYLFADKTHLASTFGRGWSQPEERWTMDEVDGKRLADVPVFVLTSKRTFSAAESFTFGLKVNDRITQIGERTGGGGHWGGEVELGHGLTMFLPAGRTYDPKTGHGWEAEGIKPEIEVPYDKALDTAVLEAGQTLGKS